MLHMVVKFGFYFFELMGFLSHQKKTKKKKKEKSEWEEEKQLSNETLFSILTWGKTMTFISLIC